MKSGNCRKRHSETTWTNLDRFDMMWQVTILLDCCQSSVVPLLRHSEARSLGPGPGYMPRIQLGWLTGASWNTICPFGIGQMDENTNSRQKHATQRLESTWYFEATSLQEARSTCSGTKREEDDYDILRLECHAISFNQARRSQQMLSRLRRYGCWGLDAEFLNSQDSWRILIWAFGRVKCWVQLRNVVKRSQRSQICRPGWTYHLCLVDMAWPGSRCGKIWQDMASNSKIWQDSRGQGMCERCWFDMVWHYLTMSFLLVYDVSGLEANCVSIKFPQQIFNACLTTPHELSSFWGHPPEIYGHDCNPIAQSHTITISRVCAYLHGLKLWRSVTGCDELWRVGDLVISNLWIISWRHSLHLWRRGRAWQGMAGHGWLHSVVLSPCFRSRGNSAPWECGPWWSIVQMLQLCNLSEWPGATLPVQPCQCNFVGSCQILSDLVRSCHTYTGLVCLSRASRASVDFFRCLYWAGLLWATNRRVVRSRLNSWESQVIWIDTKSMVQSMVLGVMQGVYRVLGHGPLWKLGPEQTNQTSHDCNVNHNIVESWYCEARLFGQDSRLCSGCCRLPF